jgi:hypothetical protein
MAEQRDPFLDHREEALKKISGFEPTDESRRSKFQKTIRDILDEQEDGFYVLGDLLYYLTPKLASEDDWRRRDINRLLTRHREDRPIRDARRWALLALFIALIALASTFVSAIADLPAARKNLACWTSAETAERACDT